MSTSDGDPIPPDRLLDALIEKHTALKSSQLPIENQTLNEAEGEIVDIEKRRIVHPYR